MRIKTSFFFTFGLLFFLIYIFVLPPYTYSQITPTPTINLTPMVQIRGCPADDPFAQGDEAKVPCRVPSNPDDATTGDVWVRDDELTALWKAGERSRQFLYWVLTHRSIDNHSGILFIWSLSRNIVYFLLILTGIMMAIAIIIAQKSNFGSQFDFKTKAFPWFMKLLVLIIYTTFSAALVIFIIQISDIMMQFFIRSLGGDKLFNIFGYTGNSEDNYRNLIQYRNINRNNWEMVNTSMFLIRFTNMTYYVVGIMLILRKVILWFLLILSPFLAILMPYVLIRNIGWIWIGVFFQWAFYGPLFALFLGGLARIWNSAEGIPFIFDFSRRWKASEIVYPTSISILYGGPAQTTSVLNSANYVDTFAEYIISLIMLWTAIFFPWWLLRIFRDYCCEGIYAMKNILLGIYEGIKGGSLPPISPTPSPTTNVLKTSVSSLYNREEKIKSAVKLETVEDIKKTRTEDIHRAMSIKIESLKDVVNLETNKKYQETVFKNLDYLRNPMKAETSLERQKYMNIRSELYDRALKGDRLAKQTLSFLTVNKEIITQNQNLFGSLPSAQPHPQIVSKKSGISNNKVLKLITSIFKTVSQNSTLVNALSSQTNLSQTQVQSILSNLTQEQTINQPTQNLINNISHQTGVSKEKVKEVIEKSASFFKQKETFNQLVQQQQVSEKEVERVFDSLREVSIEEKEPQTIVRIVSVKSGIPEEKTNSLITSIFKTVSQNSTLVNALSSQTNLSQTQVQSILSNLTQEQTINQPTQNLINNISHQTGVSKEKVKEVIEKTSNIVNQTKEITKKISEETQTQDEEMEKVINSHLVLINQPEKFIEDNISVPPAVPIEEYEEVKNMWINQYEKGEVPISENIKNRQEWVQTDIIAITNILNKILSSDEKLKAEGLQELGYILPLLLINNLKGDQLVVYLKAKIEAAKQVNWQLEKEKEIKEKIEESQKEEEIFVEAPRKVKREKEKMMEMKKEIKPSDNSKSETETDDQKR